MKSTLKNIALGATLSLAALAAQAQSSFNFSYSFDPNNTGNGQALNITGSFTGTAAGDLISNISNISIAINGIAFSGPIVIEAADAAGNWSTSVAPVISANTGLANFVFADADVANNPGAVNNFFYISGGQVFALDFNVTDAGNNPLQGFETAANASWNVSAVPEPATWALMAAGVGFVALRRRRQA